MLNIRNAYFALIPLLLLLSSCSVIKDVKQELAVADSLSVISGQVAIRDSIQLRSVHVLLMKKADDFDLILINQTTVDANGDYKFAVAPGEYFLVAYHDANGDTTYQSDDEIATYYGQSNGPPTMIVIEEPRSYQAKQMTINGTLVNSGNYSVTIDLPTSKIASGKIVSLGDPIFSRRNALLGMIRPIEFVQSIGGGLYLFEEYDPQRIPVLFIHGIGGSLSNWETLISNLDTSRYQAVGVYYASGLRLDLISDLILNGVNQLQSQYGFNEFYVIAHSMGGLVSRSFIKKYLSTARAAEIGLFTTINSPMLGMDSANSGVKYSPLIIPSWRDVAAGSEFIQDIMAWDLPESIPYFLFFTYESGSGDDGVVSLESQIPLKLQQEATQMFGLTGSHAAVLADPLFVEQFNKVLQH
ncbi:alpha/beta hydrolase [Alteromonas flava]|uniref:alpha/beta hydrolase n=1 Tax=Alteromonas flava TaxID=2048003 RepID=UPI000C28B7EE|nr:alpha/beta hydrolase [Alteromonas flava]